MTVKTEPNTRTTFNQRFVDAVLQGCERDKGFAARLRRADNPVTEYQSWEILGKLGVDLEKDYNRLPYATVAAAIARAKTPINGKLTLGRAIAASYDDGNENSQAQARLRRLLASSDVAEVCRLLRPILALVQSRISQPLDYLRLLGQLRQFYFHTQWIKSQWAQEFYGRSDEERLSVQEDVA